MDFQTSIRTCFQKYVTFAGRASRSEYWWFGLFSFIGQLVLMFVFEPLTMVFALAILLPSLAVVVRRLHDVDRSGWWYLLILVPIVGFIVLLVWFVSKGTEGPNRFGQDPLGNAQSDDDDGNYATSSIPRAGH